MEKIKESENLIPIIIGITGHRDLREEDISELKRKVATLLKEVKDKHINSPIKVLSPLAEGADRLVARIGLNLGFGLICPLPLPVGEYKKDFETEDSQREFDELLKSAELYFELPLLPGNTAENISSYNENRNMQYAAVGAYIASHSQIFIALWNGKDIGETGGTAEIVRFRLNGIPHPYVKSLKALDVPETGSVYHIFAARKHKDTDIVINNHAPDDKYMIEIQSDRDLLYPEFWKSNKEPIPNAGIHYQGILEKIEDFNSDVINAYSQILDFRNKVNEAKSYIYESKEGNLSKGLVDLWETHGLADCLAQKNQRMTDKVIKILPAAVVIGFFFFSFFDEIWSRSVVLLLFPITLIAGYLFFRKYKKANYENKYLDYRVLAEGLRVQFYWKLGAISENVYERYLYKYKGEIDWIAQALRSLSITANADHYRSTDEHKEKTTLVKIQKLWIRNQLDYFKKKVEGNIKKGKPSLQSVLQKQERITKIFFTLSFVFIFGIILLKLYSILWMHSSESLFTMEDVKEYFLYSVFLVLIDVCIAVGAAFQAYVEQKAISEEDKQCRKMYELYRRGDEKLTNILESNNLPQAERLLVDIGDEALIENGDWLLLKRSKPLEMPIG